MNVFFTLLCILSASEAVQFNNIPDVSRAPASVCDYSASESIWARYMNAPKSGTLVFRGNEMGQGVGNVFGGLANALLLAMASRREFVVDYRVGSAQLSDIVPANKNGPTWKYTNQNRCQASIRDFNFGFSNTLPQKAVEMAMDVKRYPVLCHSGNFGLHGKELKGNISASMSLALNHSFMGCSLRFLFDITKFSKELAKSAFNFVGHLRLGDSHMRTQDSRSWFSDSQWGLHGNITDAAAKVVECMQGVARRLPELRNYESCNIIILSDSSKMKESIKSQSRGRQQPCSVKASHATPAHSVFFHGQSQIQDMFTDLFSLSNADANMLTASGFSSIGSAMGPDLYHRSYIFEHFLKMYHNLSSNEQAQQAFEDFCFSKVSEEGRGP